MKLVRDGVLEPLPTEISRPAPAVPRAVLPVIPSMRPAGFPAGLLRFDTLADSQPARKDDQHQGEAKPRKTAVTVAQVRSGIGRANAAAATRVPDVRKALDALLARWGPVKRTVVGGGRSVVAAVSRQPRAATGAAAGLLLLVAIASLASIGGGSSPTHHRTAGGPPPAVQQNTAPSPPAGGVSASPAVQAPVSLLEMTSSTSAVYQVTGPISVMLDASGPCWIQARRSGPNGGLLFQGTLVPGQSWTVAGPTWLRLGNPAAVSLTVNGEVVSPPAARGIPFDLQIG